MMLNLVGEVGEFASKIAKSIRKSEATIDKNDIFVKGEWFRSSEKDLKAEAGDILWQLSGLSLLWAGRSKMLPKPISPNSQTARTEVSLLAMATNANSFQFFNYWKEFFLNII